MNSQEQNLQKALEQRRKDLEDLRAIHNAIITSLGELTAAMEALLARDRARIEPPRDG